jgi:hypothetical protein
MTDRRGREIEASRRIYRRASEASRATHGRIREARCEALRRRLLDALRASAAPLSCSDLALALGFTSNHSILRDRMAELVAAGLAAQGTEHRRNGPQVYEVRVWTALA